jgi:hypothetical protein
MICETEVEKFRQGKRSPAFPFAYNDIVTVLSGGKAGGSAWVISLSATKPSVAYLVGHEDGSDEVLLLENLKMQ